MKNSDAPLKLPEVREILKSHKREDLEYIIAGMYKMMPKAMKLENDLNPRLRLIEVLEYINENGKIPYYI